MPLANGMPDIYASTYRISRLCATNYQFPVLETFQSHFPETGCIFSLYILPIFLTSRGVEFHALFSTIDLRSLQAISLGRVQWLSNTAEPKSFTSLAHPTLFCPSFPWITKSIVRLSFCNPLALVSGLSEVLHYFQLLILKLLKSFLIIYHAFIPVSSLTSFVVSSRLELEHFPP